MFSVRIQTGPIPLATSQDQAHDRCGAEVRFVGKVRNDARGAALECLVLEHFPGVTESEIERIVGLARQRWSLQKVSVVHRVGRIAVGEDIVVVETASAHRRDAYEANVFIMDYLKTEAPFWKQECFADGRAHWVEARASDQRAAQRWRAEGQPGAGPVSASAHGRRIGALILAGGEGSRMGYLNKGLQPLHGRPLAQHVADGLRPHVDFLAISANHDLAAYESLGATVIADDPAFGVRGPLAGILSALGRFPPDLDAIMVAPCDAPLLPADLVPRLAAALFVPDGPPAVVAATAGHTHYSIFMCRPGMLISLIPRMREPSDFSLRGWLRACGCATLQFDDEQAFANVNDLPALQALRV